MNVYLKSICFLFLTLLLYVLTGGNFHDDINASGISFTKILIMGFWSYILLSVIEYFLSKRRIRDGEIQNFIFSRMISIIAVPWLITTWYLFPGMLKEIDKVPYFFIVWPLILIYISGLFVAQFESETEKVVFTRLTRIFLIITLIAVMIATHVFFNF